jgi:hypothetical protein
MRAMHWIARISSVGFGVLSTVPFMLFAPLHPLSGFSCWCAYGVPQWTFETISFSIITVLQGIALVSFLIVNTRREWRYDYGAKVFPRVKFGMSTLLILQFIALLMHLLLIAEILQIGQENFEVDPIWLQPLVVLILITDGGGFVLMFIFSTSDTTWETYRKIWYTSWVRVAGETQTRMLRNLALHMVTDPKLMDSYRPNYSVPRQANTFSGCDAVDWMLKHGDCACRDEAFQRCIQMQQKNLIKTVAWQPLSNFTDAEDYLYTINRPKFTPKCLRTSAHSASHDQQDEEKAETVAPTIEEDFDCEHESDDSELECSI